jgi:hypothetical protein
MNKPAKAQEPSMDEILASIRRIIADDDAAKAQTGHAPESVAPTPSTAPPRHPGITAPGLRAPFSARPAAPPAAGSAQEERSRPEEQTAASTRRFEIAPEREFADRHLSDIDEPASEPLVPPAANAGVPPHSGYATRLHQQPAAPHYHPTPSYQPAANNPAPRHTEPEPPVFRDSGVHATQPAVQTHEEPRRHLAQSAVEQALLSTTTSAAVDSAFGMLTQKPSSQPFPHMPGGQGTRSIEELVQDMLRPMLKNWLDDNLPSLVERLVRAEIERVSRGR